MGSLRGGDGHEHGAHLIAPIVLVRAGYAGGGQGDVASQSAPGALCHSLGYGSGYGSVLIKKLLGDPKNVVLYFIGVRDDAALEHLRGSGHIREPFGHQSAGAAFRGADGQSLFPQQVFHHELQRGHIHSVDQGTEVLF